MKKLAPSGLFALARLHGPHDVRLQSALRTTCVERVPVDVIDREWMIRSAERHRFFFKADLGWTIPDGWARPPCDGPWTRRFDRMPFIRACRLPARFSIDMGRPAEHASPLFGRRRHLVRVLRGAASVPAVIDRPPLAKRAAASSQTHTCSPVHNTRGHFLASSISTDRLRIQITPTHPHTHTGTHFGQPRPPGKPSTLSSLLGQQPTGV